MCIEFNHFCTKGKYALIKYFWKDTQETHDISCFSGGKWGKTGEKKVFILYLFVLLNFEPCDVLSNINF